MKILVTGHKGFIGSHVYEYFTDLGFDVDGYDRPDDLGDFKTDKIYDVVIHLAANAAIREAVANPDLFWENNVEKSKPIFDYCRDNNVRCLYASSAAVYEWWINAYGISKKVNEVQAPPNSVGMRFFNVYAERVSRTDMLYRMLEDKTATYLTRHKRDWIHVDDIVSAIATLIPSSYTGVLDVGTGDPVSVIDLATKMGMGHLPIKEDTPGERDITCADPSKLMELGWRPTINILDTVKTNESS
jgi:dTDP-glucose 4,6-dehydratase/UDP-glucose 4-epimerase|tara:strand:+ start:13 stop:744 length:732 start_codon:yes stop_codon:yes gene_type:complete